MFSRRMSTAVVVLVVLLVTLGLVASALPVFASSAAALPAHARLVTTTPADGAEVGTVRSVGLTFNEEVDERFLRVTVEGPDGSEADGAPEVEGSVVTQPLVADLAAGEHTVTYRVVSVDGHPVSGSFSFTTTEEPTTATPTPTASETASAPPSATSAPTPTPAPSTAPVAADASPGWVLPVLVLVVVGVLGGLVALLSGRRGARPEELTDDRT